MLSHPMRPQIQFVALLAGLAAAIPAASTASAQTRRTFDGATAFSDYASGQESFALRLGTRRCTLDASTVALACESASSRARLQLPSDDGTVENVRHLSTATESIIAYELTDGEGGWTKLVRVDLANLRLVWEADLPSFNISDPLVEGASMFVAASGVVAKLDLNTGRFGWLVRGLYDYLDRSDCAKPYNTFARPRRDGDYIVFADGDDRERMLELYDAPVRR